MAEQKSFPDITIDTRDIPTYYVNHAHVNISLTDIRIYFGESSPKSYKVGALVDPEIIVNPKIAIVINPEFANSMLAILKSSIDKYEAKFGNLREGPSLILSAEKK